mgnify:CR=1 FL=1
MVDELDELNHLPRAVGVEDDALKFLWAANLIFVELDDRKGITLIEARARNQLMASQDRELELRFRQLANGCRRRSGYAFFRSLVAVQKEVIHAARIINGRRAD